LAENFGSGVNEVMELSLRGGFIAEAISLTVEEIASVATLLRNDRHITYYLSATKFSMTGKSLQKIRHDESPSHFFVRRNEPVLENAMVTRAVLYQGDCHKKRVAIC